MKTLIFGGTRFLGRAIAGVCFARGHEVTLFHRGRSNPNLFPNASHILGDRTSDLHLLGGRMFDAVIDTNGFEVGEVRKTARAIGTAHYTFVSTISVYSDIANMDETGPIQTIADPETAPLTQETFENYGALKAACEKALNEELSHEVLSIRAGKIDGPHDVDERFRYWLCRIAEGGEVLAPGNPDALVQEIDVRDLADWIVRMTEERATGTFNATGEPMPMRAFLATIARAVGDAKFVWVPDEILIQNDVRAYEEMPHWLPKNLGAQPVPIARALAKGLKFRPFIDTVQDTWKWMQRGWDEEANVRAQRRIKRPSGMARDRERAILARAR